MAVHRRDHHPRGTLVVLSALIGVALVGLMALIAASRPHGVPVAAQESPTPTEPTTPARACERDAVQALTRTALEMAAGGSSDASVAQEYQRLDGRAYAAYSASLNDFLEAAPIGDQQGLAARLQVVMPTVRRMCAQ
ncbi:hypothetical protein [Actinomadura violacea]|uniref:Hemophore-related protein n=1 Tax=Actinomadura violacea TaxID=2819934 RepID=A0ABS3RW58_9ACTN|nr:hypothetical protein [Actinomadura violacea]MBO2460985.1 hypothetical protein [Actinomadura violacea]